MQFAQVPFAAFDLAAKVDANRYKLRPETAKGAVADLYVMAARSSDGSISYNPRYWGIRWEWNSNEVSRLLKRLVDEGFFTLRSNGDGSNAIIPSKNNVSRTVSKTTEVCNRQTGSTTGQPAKVVSILKSECKQDVTELLDLQLTEKKYSSDAVIFATSRGRKKQLGGEMARWFLELYEAYGDKRGRAEAAWAFLEIPGLDAELLSTRIIPAAKEYAAKRPALVAKGLTPKMLQFWITAMRWEDYDPAASSHTTGRSAAELTRQKYLEDQA